MEHPFNPSTQDRQAVDLCEFPGPHREFQDSQDYAETTSQKDIPLSSGLWTKLVTMKPATLGTTFPLLFFKSQDSTYSVLNSLVAFFFYIINSDFKTFFSKALYSALYSFYLFLFFETQLWILYLHCFYFSILFFFSFLYLN